ncbi:MAG: phage terminase large subunit family protein [Rubrivivax sp.]|nr:phage terminase large subunit family protein [Rubrivivax sp.]
MTGDLELLLPPAAAPSMLSRLAQAVRPRKVLTVSEWADAERRLSSKGSAEAGRWVTARNPPTREPMDAMSLRSPVREVVLMWPIQFAKTEVALNVVGYTMDYAPGPIMVTLPGEVSLNKWTAQKLHPMIEETPAVRRSLVSTSSREASNTRTFKDFAGGQLFLEHAGTSTRLKMTSARTVIADELDEFAANLPSGDDPVEMLNGRTSAFPSTFKRLYISSPQMKSTSRTWYLWERSDQRHYHVACPHCGERQPLVWAGLKWDTVVHSSIPRRAWYVCRDCGGEIEEHHKTRMIERGGWVPHAPDVTARRGYTLNCLYYQLGLGPRWADLAQMWLDAQGDQARLKTFVNDRLAEPWEDKGTAHVRANIVQERAEPYALRTAPAGVLRITAGVDTQDDRFEVQITGWGRGMSFWVLDYVVIPGDPDADTTRAALTELLNRPIQHACGALMQVEATSVDMLGHRTEAVKAWVRSRTVRRPMASFGSTNSTAPLLGKAKLQDVTWRGQNDKRGVHSYPIGTVNAKHVLFGRLAADHEAQQKWLHTPEPQRPAAPDRSCHFSDQVPPGYFEGLISEIYNPSKNRFEKRRGSVRNEPLDTWVHSYAAAHHPELRLHRATRADWDLWEAQLLARAAAVREGPAGAASDQPALIEVRAPAAPTDMPARASSPAAPRSGGRRW